MISFSSTGRFEKTDGWLKRMKRGDVFRVLDKYGQLGVAALTVVTPMDLGNTANLWSYEIERKRNNYTIHWTNTHINQGVNIAVILQYGHGTGTGGYVVGRDYINPAIRPIFDKMADDVWKEVTK